MSDGARAVKGQTRSSVFLILPSIPRSNMIDATIPSARPDPNTYWVIEGRFLAGEYPGARDPAQARRKIAAFLNAGITTFIDLTEPHELAPYEPLLADAGAEYNRFPIRDMSVPRDVRTCRTSSMPSTRP